MTAGKIVTIFLLLGLIYSAFSIMDPSHKKLSVNDIVIPKTQKENYEKIIKEVTQSKIDYEEKKKEKEKIETQKTVLSKKSNIVFKLKKYIIIKDHMLIDAYIYNPNHKTINQRISVSCTGYEDNVAVDKFIWTKDLNIKPKKVLLIEDMDFGYVTADAITSLKCLIN